ncbi:MAG: hypothetical protein GY696_24080 [Gammaproteobacteria bacterium]|nr:hypothetical protein [Gammaproteobacteria bacterium]
MGTSMESTDDFMMRILEEQKSMFQEMCSQLRQGATTSGDSTTWSTSQPHLHISSEYMDDGEDEYTLPEFRGGHLKFKGWRETIHTHADSTRLDQKYKWEYQKASLKCSALRKIEGFWKSSGYPEAIKFLESVYGGDRLHNPQLWSELYKIVSQEGSTPPISEVNSQQLQRSGGNQGSSSSSSQHGSQSIVASVL